MSLPSKFAIICGVGCVALIDNFFNPTGRNGLDRMKPTLSVREEPARIVLAWNGEVREPMREKFASAFARLANDPRPITVALNSPGGSVAHGRAVAEVIRAAGQRRHIDTLVGDGAVCASMCVPIFLTGAERVAGPQAHFMFHEASLSLPADKPTPQRAKHVGTGAKAGRKTNLGAAVGDEERIDPDTRGMIVALVTDDLFEQDIGKEGVDAAWLARMRKSIVGQDVWISAQQLFDERSGVVDKLVARGSR